jgi:transposase InsO family protein
MSVGISPMLVHRRMGHMGWKRLVQAAATKDAGLPLATLQAAARDPPLCEPCIKEKAHRLPGPPRATQPGEHTAGSTWHMDFVPVAPGYGGVKGYRLAIDQASRFALVHCVSEKGNADATVRKLRTELILPLARHLSHVHADWGGEARDGVFVEGLAALGAKATYAAPRTPESNGLCERAVRSLEQTRRCIMTGEGVRGELWPFAVQHAALLYNCSPHSALGGKTPWEAYYGTVRAVGDLRVFGCTAYVLAAGPGRLVEKAWQGRFMGFCPDTPGAFLVWNDATRRVVVSRDVSFVEEPLPGAVPGQQQQQLQQQQQRQQLAPTADDDEQHAQTEQPGAEAPAAAAGEGEQQEPEEPGGAGEEQLPQQEPGGEAAQQQLQQEPERQQQAPAPRRGSTRSGRTYTSPRVELLREAMLEQQRHLREGEGGGEAALAATLEGLPDAVMLPPEGQHGRAPCNYKEHRGSSEAAAWDAAFAREQAALFASGAATLVPRAEAWAAGATVLRSQVVYTEKLSSEGLPYAKVRICADGSRQVYQVDYTACYSPVIGRQTLLLLAAAAVRLRAPMRTGDFPTAFLNAKLDTPQYMQLPPGFVLPDGAPADPVLKLHRCLYGLHQSGAMWYAELKSTMEELGFECCIDGDLCLFFNKDTGVIMGVYTDDTFITNLARPEDEAGVMGLVEELQRRYKYKDLGRPRRLLGMEFTHGDDGSLTIAQERYVKELLEAYEMEGAHAVLTPAAARVEAFNDSPLLEADAVREYGSLMGALGWVATSTRPDIACTVSQLQRYTAAPRRAHMAAARRVLAYLGGTRELGLRYAPGGEGAALDLVGFADASFADDERSSRSTAGFVFTLGGTAVAWRSKLQSLVTLSTAEAEYVALSDACKVVVVLQRTLAFLGFDVRPVPMHEDNASALRLTVDPSAAQRTRHIAVRFHHVREQVAGGTIVIVAVPTALQRADLMTKPLPAPLHATHRAAIMGYAR